MNYLVALVFLTSINNIQVLSVYQNEAECVAQMNGAANLYCIPTTFNDIHKSQEQIVIFYKFLLNDKEALKKYFR